MAKEPVQQSFMEALSALDAPAATDGYDWMHQDDAAAFYPGAGRQEFVDHAAYLSQFIDGVVLILADEGVGKSSVAAALAQQLGVDGLVSFIAAGRLVDARQVFAEIANTLELPFAVSAGEQLATIRTHVQDADAERLNVIIDDAHLLDDQVLSSLLSLFQGYALDAIKPITLTLFGLPELAQRVDGFQLVDVRVNDLELPLLQPEEMADYLQFKCRARLARGLPIPSESVLDRWVHQARGNLGLVEALWQQELESLAPTLQPELEQMSASPDKSRKISLHIVVVAILLGLLPVLYFYSSDQGQIEADDAEAASSLKPTTSTAIDIAKQWQTQGQTPQPQVVEPEPVVVKEEADKLSQQSAPDVSVQAPTVVESMPEKSGGLDRQAEAAVPPPPKVEPVEVAVQSAPVNPVMPLSKDESALLAEPETAYTLQILGVSRREAAEDYRRAQSNKADLRLFESRRQGKPWFVIVLGSYPDKVQAREAIKSLPAKQQKAGPWPRSLLSIQMEIKDVRGI